MKQQYLFALVFSIISMLGAKAQVEANDDVLTNYNPSNLQYNVLANDLLNGVPAAYSAVVITQLSTSNPSVYLSNGYVYIGPNATAGTYTIVYKICEVANPGNCDTATVTVSYCSIPAPVISSVPAVSCTETPKVVLSNLPATGTWYLYCMRYQMPDLIVTGTGTTATVNLDWGIYRFRVINGSGCSSSATATTSVGYYSQNGFNASLSGTPQDLDNNGYLNVGDVINYQVTATSVLTCDGHVEVFDESQQVVLYNPGTTISAGATDISVTGYYVLKQADITAGHVSKWLGVYGITAGGSMDYSKIFCNVNLNLPDGVKLNAFVDLNSDGIQNNGELPASGIGHFTYQLNNGPVHNLYTSGAYHIYDTNPANSYNFSYIVDAYASQYTLQPGSINNVTIAAGSGITTLNFPLTAIPYSDTAVHVNNYNGMPGALNRNLIVYQNNGNATVPAGTLIFNHTPALSIASVSQAGTVAIPNGFTYNFTDLLPHESRVIDVWLQVPPLPEVALGDVLTSTVSVTLEPADVIPANNSFTAYSHILGAYDPNDKSEAHGGPIPYADFTDQDYLTYTIRFENTGNANALNIKISDLLDDKLDENSLRMVYATHPYVLDRMGSQLTWSFNGANLPPSVVGSSTGKGFLTFQAKPKTGLQAGDIIPNHASIYFDFNPAITTNIVNTEFTATLSSSDLSKSKLLVWPVPVHDMLNIEPGNKTLNALFITDLSGKTLLSVKAPQSNQVDLSSLGSGLYFLKISTEEGTKTIKILKN